MGFFSKLFKGPEIDMEKSNANAKKMRVLFNHVVTDGDNYRLIFGYTEDVSRFNYGLFMEAKTKIGNFNWLAGMRPAKQSWSFPQFPIFLAVVTRPTTATLKF